MTAPRPWIIWTSELSPFGLKVVVLCRHSGMSFRLMPAEGTRLEHLKYLRRQNRVAQRKLPLTWPQMTKDDEFPLVPFLFGPDGENIYDSTAIGVWLDRGLQTDRRTVPEEPIAGFVTRLIDDYADELCLYFVHHNRWLVSARDNDAGERLLREFRIPWPVSRLMLRWWNRRQTQRLPYLFSVAPKGFRVDEMPDAIQPPSIEGFPPTHELLETAFARLLDILEVLLSRRRFVLGDQLTLADASLYGQLGMNLSDPSADRLIRARAPGLHAWLERMHRGDPELLKASGSLRIDEDLRPLLGEICRVFVPLMQQNRAACERFRQQGETVFNERAFNQNRALYDGQIDGYPFRHVAKTFQSKVWRERVTEWLGLPPDTRRAIEGLLPAGHGLDRLASGREE
jgi:glutathione S-transferase